MIHHGIDTNTLPAVGFNSEILSTSQDLDINDQDVYMQHREPLEMYGFLVFWLISVTEQKATSRAATMDKAGKAVVSELS